MKATEALAVVPDDRRDDLPRASLPAWRSPMLAVLEKEPFSDPDWIYERKFDGVRVLVRASGSDVGLLSRNRSHMDAPYPEIGDAVRELALPPLLADGEIVAFDGKRTSFSRLQARIGLEDPDEARATGVAVYVYLFDILHLGDRDLRDLPLRTRKTILRRAVPWNRRVRFSAHRNRVGESYLREACGKGWEGIVAKRAASPYRGSRSTDWRKFKCGHRQELVIGGWTDPRGSRTGFGALLLGYHEDGLLRYAGKVGTGFDDDLLERLSRRLRGLVQDTCPFTPEPRTGSDVHWVTPRLVGEVGFTEWTRDGMLRHPRFLGLRTDKKARDVHRERPR